MSDKNNSELKKLILANKNLLAKLIIIFLQSFPSVGKEFDSFYLNRAKKKEESLTDSIPFTSDKREIGVFEEYSISENTIPPVLEQETEMVLRRILEDIQLPEFPFGDFSRNNIIFFGVAGNGKKAVAKDFSRSLSLPILTVKASDLISIDVGKTVKNIQCLSDFLESRKTILFLRNFELLSNIYDFIPPLENLLERPSLKILEVEGNILLDSILINLIHDFVEFKPLSKLSRKVLIKRHLPDLPPESIDNICENIKDGISGKELISFCRKINVLQKGESSQAATLVSYWESVLSKELELVNQRIVPFPVISKSNFL